MLKKRAYKEGIIVCSLMLIIFFFNHDKIKKSELESRTLVLSCKPEFKITKTIKGTKYRYLELSFQELPHTFKIDHFDYKFLRINEFQENIKQGDTLKILYNSNKIYYFEKDNKGYMNFEKAQKYNNDNYNIVQSIFLTGLILCIIPLCFKKKPIVNFYNHRIELNFNIILIVGIIIVIGLLYIKIGFESFKNEEFIINKKLKTTAYNSTYPKGGHSSSHEY